MAYTCVYGSTVESKAFKTFADEQGDEWLKEPQAKLLLNPGLGEVIQKRGGFRELRVGIEGGKRSGVRIIYLKIPKKGVIAFILAYKKSRQDDLGADDLKALRQISKRMKG